MLSQSASRALPAWPLIPALILLAVLFHACKENDTGTAPIIKDPQDTLPHIDTLLTDSIDPRNCVENPVVFTEYLIDPSLVKAVGEIGSVTAKTEIGGRSYIFPKDGQNGQRLLLKVPADMRLTGIRHYKPLEAPDGYTADWSIALQAGCGIWLEVYHVKDLSDSLKKLVDTAIYTSSAWEPLPGLGIRLKAGQTLGWYIPGPSAVSFDFVAHNDSITNQFTNQARYVARLSNILNVVCPYDLFEASKKAAYYSVLGTGTGNAVPGAGCGTTERDVAGTPAGQWFFDSGFVTERPLLRKDGHYGEPLPLIISADSTMQVGHIGPTDDFRIPRSNPTWKPLKDITTEHCYQAISFPPASAPEGWLWLKMVTSTKMDVAYSPTGACPTNFPASGFKTYYR